VAGLGLALGLAPRPASAHAGHCTRPETISTFGVSIAVAVLLIRPWRRSALSVTSKLSRLFLPLLLAGAITLTGCGGKSSKSSVRPTTAARLQIVFPTPNAVTPPDITLKLNLV